MVDPHLWGPGAWELLFASTWVVNKKNMELLRLLVFKLVPALLPCDLCRNHFHENARDAFRKVPQPDTPERVFEWLHELKCRVNASTGARSLTLNELHKRYRFRDGIVNETAVCDALVCFAIAAERLQRPAEFVQMCAALSELLPIPADAALRDELSRVRERSVVAGAVRCARVSRIELGLRPNTVAHYRSFAD